MTFNRVNNLSGSNILGPTMKIKMMSSQGGLQAHQIPSCALHFTTIAFSQNLDQYWHLQLIFAK